MFLSLWPSTFKTFSWFSSLDSTCRLDWLKSECRNIRNTDEDEGWNTSARSQSIRPQSCKVLVLRTGGQQITLFWPPTFNAPNTPSSSSPDSSAFSADSHNASWAEQPVVSCAVLSVYGRSLQCRLVLKKLVVASGNRTHGVHMPTQHSNGFFRDLRSLVAWLWSPVMNPSMANWPQCDFTAALNNHSQQHVTASNIRTSWMRHWSDHDGVDDSHTSVMLLLFQTWGQRPCLCRSLSFMLESGVHTELH